MKRSFTFIIFAILSTITTAQWYLQNSLPTEISFYGVKFISAKVGWAVGVPGTIMKTTDGGTTWDVQLHNTNYGLYGISFADSNTGTVVGGTWNSDSGEGIILRTTDGGATWLKQTSGTTYRLFGIHFTDTKYGVAVGGIGEGISELGIILGTTNGGSNWQPISLIVDCKLNAVHFIDHDNGIIVGNGRIIRTTDGGLKWQNQDIAFNNLMDVTFTNNNNGIIIGDQQILKTTDGGATWAGITGFGLHAISFSDQYNGTAVGQWGSIQRTTDAGSSWKSQASGTTKVLYDVSFSDVNNGTIVGEYGTILRTTNGGITFIGEGKNTTKPQNFVLAQNNPNPFNPSTTISYCLSSASNVKLIVYNTLGETIEILENGYRNAGNYSINFNASDLPSGVYFYKLEAGQFSEINKMILLK